MGEQRVLILSMLERFVKHLVKAYGVDEETSVDSIDQVDFHILSLQENSVDIVAGQGLLLTRLEHYSWDV